MPVKARPRRVAAPIRRPLATNPANSTLRAACIGAGAGVVGAAAMNLVQWLWSETIDGNGTGRLDRLGQGGPLTKAAESQTATERLGGRLERPFVDHEPTKGERQVAGIVLHALTGAAAGATYGAAANVTPRVTIGRGAPFGLAVWLLADQLMLPVLKLSRPPTQHRATHQAMNVLAHLVFGLTTDALRRFVSSLRSNG